MANLPDNRVTPSEPPFSYVGVDCFGPLDVCWGRSTVKWYGVLFTCLSIWAIHIEVAHSMDKIPSLMLSDDVLLEEDKLCWWDLTMVEILWKPRESYVKLFATGIKARFTTFFWQETSSGFSILLPRHIMGVFGSDAFVLCGRWWKLSRRKSL